MRNRRWLWGVLIGTTLLALGALFQIAVIGGSTMKDLTEREYEQAKRPIRELQLLNGSRPYTAQEWRLLMRTAQDKHTDFGLRVRAITALWQTPDPRQQREVVKLAAALLDDCEPTVRAYAANALAVLKAKQYLPRVERMAVSDPDPIVRQAAKAALKRFAR